MSLAPAPAQSLKEGATTQSHVDSLLVSLIMSIGASSGLEVDGARFRELGGCEPERKWPSALTETSDGVEGIFGGFVFPRKMRAGNLAGG